MTRIEYFCPAVRPVKIATEEVGRVIEILGTIVYAYELAPCDRAVTVICVELTLVSVRVGILGKRVIVSGADIVLPLPFTPVHTSEYERPDTNDVNTTDLACITDGTRVTPSSVKIYDVAKLPPVQRIEHVESVTATIDRTVIVGGGGRVIIGVVMEGLNP